MSGPLAELLKSEGWRILQDLLRSMRVEAREIALEQHGRKEGEVMPIEFWQGYVAGLQASQEAPGQILAIAEAHDRKGQKAGRLRQSREVFVGGGEDTTF